MYGLKFPTQADYDMDKYVSTLNLNDRCLRAYDAIGMAFKHSILSKYNDKRGIIAFLAYQYKIDKEFCDQSYDAEHVDREKRWASYRAK